MTPDEAYELLDHPVISERYFFPRPGRPAQPVLYQGVDGLELCCSQRLVDPALKTLVHFHGNGEIVADYDDGYVDALAALGVNVLMLEYRGYGGSQGSPQLGKMLQDVGCVIEQIGLQPAQIFVYGRSVGAIFAVEWARLQPDIAGLVLESGVADPLQRLEIRLRASELGVTDDALRQACSLVLDHQKKLREFRSPMLVLHAAQDDLVGPEHAEAHMQYHLGTNKKLVIYPRGDHNTILGANWPAYLQDLKAFFQSFF